MSAIPSASLDTGANPTLSGLFDQFSAYKTQPLAVLAEINQSLTSSSIGLQFELDAKSGQIIRSVVSVETGKQMRQMPSEELVQLFKMPGELHEILVNQAICRKAQLAEQSPVPAPARWGSSWIALDTSSQ